MLAPPSIRRTNRGRSPLVPLAAPGAGGEAGFTLVGLLIVVAVVNVAMMVVVSSWVTLDKRAREAELIFRGEAIARAIACYKQNNASQPLERLEQLVKANCLRRLYPDPMTKDGEWRILRQEDLTNGTIAELLALETEPQEGQEGSAPTRQLLGPPVQGQAPSGGRQIIGVVSTSKASGLRELRTRRKYGEWVFITAS